MGFRKILTIFRHLLIEQTYLAVACTDLKIVTKDWGYENSWTFGDCSSSEVYNDDQTYYQECCQTEGEYSLICEDKYGDGWHGGYIEVDGKKWCEDFTSGHAQEQSIVLRGNAGRYLFHLEVYTSMTLDNIE